jgi:hypothetical protein
MYGELIGASEKQKVRLLTAISRCRLKLPRGLEFGSDCLTLTHCLNCLPYTDWLPSSYFYFFISLNPSSLLIFPLLYSTLFLFLSVICTFFECLFAFFTSLLSTFLIRYFSCCSNFFLNVFLPPLVFVYPLFLFLSISFYPIFYSAFLHVSLYVYLILDFLLALFLPKPLT